MMARARDDNDEPTRQMHGEDLRLYSTAFPPVVGA